MRWSAVNGNEAQAAGDAPHHVLLPQEQRIDVALPTSALVLQRAKVGFEKVDSHTTVDSESQHSLSGTEEDSSGEEGEEAKAGANVGERLIGGLEFLKVAGAVLIYMMNSSGFIALNAYIVSAGGFPYVLAAFVWQMLVVSCLTRAIYAWRPAWYPSLSGDQPVALDRDLMLRVMLPISVLFATHVVLFNSAFMFATVALLQILRKSNVIIMYAMGCAFGLESFGAKKVTILLVIAAATTAAVTGEVRLQVAGLILQVSGMVCDAIRTTMMAIQMSPKSGRKLDPMTYTMLMAPLAFVASLVYLAACACASAYLPWMPPALALPPVEAWWRCRWLLVFAGLLAYLQNVLNTLVIKLLSPVTVMVCNALLRDSLVVVASAAMQGHPLSAVQVVAFAVQTIASYAWGRLRMQG